MQIRSRGERRGFNRLERLKASKHFHAELLAAFDHGVWSWATQGLNQSILFERYSCLTARRSLHGHKNRETFAIPWELTAALKFAVRIGGLLCGHIHLVLPVPLLIE